MKKKYYSDIISEEQIKKWIDNNDYVYLNGDMGSGKSTFIFNKVLPMIDFNKYDNIFILSNRAKLKTEHQKKLFETELDKEFEYFNYGERWYNFFKIMTYQGFYDKYIENKKKDTIRDMVECMNEGNYLIICDEFHYFLDDYWNDKNEKLKAATYKTLQVLLAIHAPTLFLSATGKNASEFINKIGKNKIKSENIITIKRDYSYITLHSYEERQKYKNNGITGTETAVSMIKNILDNSNDKVMYYLNNKLKLADVAEKLNDYGDDIKVCYKGSQENPLTKDNKINGRCILTTKILDNGIDIYDDDLKHVIIDMSDLNAIIQAIGRRRTTETKLNVYIHNISKKSIYGYLKQTQSKYDDAKNKNRKHLMFIYSKIMEDYKSFISSTVIGTVYRELRDTGIQIQGKNNMDSAKNILNSWMIKSEELEKDYCIKILSELGFKGKTLKTINKELCNRLIKYQFEQKEKGHNHIKYWIVKGA